MSEHLPAELSELVRETVRRTRLWMGEREDVACELTAHFSDGLSAGRSPEQLAAEFGDPAQAAALITRARRRMRPVAWRIGIQVARAAAVAAALALVLYAVSAARLYSAAPSVSARGVIPDSGAAETTLRDRRSASRAEPATIDLSVAWPRAAPAARALSDSVSGLVVEARAAGASSDGGRAMTSLRSALDKLAVLEASTTLPGQLEALAARADLMGALASMIGEEESGLAAEQLDAARLLAHDMLAYDSDHAREALRSALDHLLDRIYAPDGRLSAQGLRLLQAMMGKTDPGALALVLEPAYFAFPADRDEVLREADRILALAGSDRLVHEVSSLRSSPLRSLRFFPLTLVMPTTVAALERSARAEARLGAAVSRFVAPAPRR